MTACRPLLVITFLAGLAGCAAETSPDDLGATVSELTAAERRARAGQIRDAAAGAGLEQGWLLAGIADAETNLCHCWHEATWACQGPYSADCGGAVIAGAYDGSCSAQQGGLGMFQFDAGTYDDTLAREGTRILSIAGNVEAAIDFTASMVVRSVYISGVDDRAQAIAWMNGVRIGNERWDPWIRTVTHYYNGCTPSDGCFSTRYARYRDITAGVHAEMGADFWIVGNDYAAAYAHQSFPLAADPFELVPGQEVGGFIEMRNTGTATWQPGETYLGTTEPRDVASPLAGPDWVSPSRPATIDRVVAPGETGRFDFTVRAPAVPGDYPQFFNLVQEGVTWFSQQGGPPDDQLQVRVTVVAAGDGDLDGADASVDCDDGSASVFPGAAEVCGDGVDQDCDGVDLACGPSHGDAASPDGDAGMAGRPDGPTSGCAATPSRSSRSPSRASLIVLAALALASARTRMRRAPPHRIDAG